MVDNPPKGTPQIFSRLAYRDPDAAVAWLGRAFGFRERPSSRLSAADGRISLTEMELGAGVVMLGIEGSHDLHSPTTLGGRTQMVMVFVDSVDEHCARAKTSGARIVMELQDQPWGDRRYEALDLEGHRWYFAQHVRDVRPDDWKQEVKH